jgi:hypothetical protein
MRKNLLTLIPLALLTLLLLAGGTGCPPAPEQPGVEPNPPTQGPDEGRDDTQAGERPGPTVVIEPGSGGGKMEWEINNAPAVPIEPQGDTLNEELIADLSEATMDIQLDLDQNGTMEDVTLTLDSIEFTLEADTQYGYPEQTLLIERSGGKMVWTLGGTKLKTRKLATDDDIREVRRDVSDRVMIDDTVLLKGTVTTGGNTIEIEATGPDLLKRIDLHFN